MKTAPLPPRRKKAAPERTPIKATKQTDGDVHVSVPFTPELHAILERCCATEGRSRARQIRHFTEPHLLAWAAANPA